MNTPARKKTQSSAVAKASIDREREEIREFVKLSATEKFRLLTQALEFLRAAEQSPESDSDSRRK